MVDGSKGYCLVQCEREMFFFLSFLGCCYLILVVDILLEYNMRP
jgi:hypothetical protein